MNDATPADPAQSVHQLLLKHRHALLGYLYMLLHDYHAAEDVFQEVSLVVIEKAGEFKPGTSFVAWARTIARHKLHEHLRSRRGVIVDEQLLVTLEGTCARVEARGILEARKNALRHCLGTLPERPRRLVVLRYERGLAPGELARQTGQSRTAINSLLQRIREKLRACVERRLALLEG